MTLLGFHELLGWIVVLSNGLTGTWVLVAHWRPEARIKWLWPLVVASQASIGLQAFLGVVVQQVDRREASGIHMFYGFLAFATVGILYSYRQQVEEWRFLLYGFGGLFLMGLATRSMGWI